MKVPSLCPCARRSIARMLSPSACSIGAHAIAPTFASAYPWISTTQRPSAAGLGIHHAARSIGRAVRSSWTVNVTSSYVSPRSAGDSRFNKYTALPSVMRRRAEHRLRRQHDRARPTEDAQQQQDSRENEPVFGHSSSRQIISGISLKSCRGRVR